MVQSHAHISQENKRRTPELLTGNSLASFAAPSDTVSAEQLFNIKLINRMGR
jgi:hypothetical protein